MRVNLVTVCKKNCGISDYSMGFFRELRKIMDAKIVDNKGKDFNSLAEVAKDADIAHIQFEPGAFGSFAMLRGTSVPYFFTKLSSPKKAKIVTTIHEINESRITGFRSFLVHFYQKFINYFVFSKSDAIIVHSRFLEGFARKRNQNVFFMPMACKGIHKRIGKQSAKKRMGLNGKKVLLIFGQVEPRKQHEIIIRVMPELNENTVLLIAGTPATSGNYLGSLKNLCREKNVEGRVIFCGFVKDRDVPLVFSASDLVLYPYSQIYQSESMVDALGFGKPILASDISGFREFREEFGCIELCGKKKWKEKIVQLLANEKRQAILRKEGREYCRRNSWKKAAERTVGIYKQLLSGK